jgi:pSer/pThr/pTyr-binding forkhead associated (FHA) protein
MDVRLVIEQGKSRKQTLRLTKDEAVIGRESGCDFRIPSSQVSRRHCRLRVKHGYVLVEDLNSSNGTQLNGEAVEGVQVVRPGDRLVVGPVTFLVEYQLTPEAIDRLLRGEDSSVAYDELEVLADGEAAPAGEELPLIEAAEEDVLPEVEAVEENLPPVEDVEVLDDGTWQLPEADELRDLMTGIEEDEKPKKRKKRK